MVLRRRSLLTKTIPFLLAGLAVYVVYLIYFVGLGDMVSMIGQVNRPIYLAAVAATIAEMTFFALAWNYFPKPLSTAFSFKKALFTLGSATSLIYLSLQVAYSLALALKSIPIGVPAEVGLTEIAMTTLFGAFGVPLLLSGAATVLIRVITVWFKFAIGLVAVRWVGLKTVLETETFQK